MNLYEIINPSDPYTFRAPDFLTGAAVVLLVGKGSYGLRRADGEDSEELPFFVFNPGAAEEWLAQHYGNFGEWLKEHVTDLADALESVMSFRASERRAYDEACALLPPDKLQAYRDKTHDANRSSMNDIGARAWQLAEQVRKNAE